MPNWSARGGVRAARCPPPNPASQAYRLGPHRWGLRWYDAAGTRRRKSPFPSKSTALDHYRTVIEPELRGDAVPMPEITLAELVELYLQRHAATVRPRTIATLRDRLRHAVAAFGDVPLRDLERMADEIAAWQAQLPPRAGHGIAQALRQVLDAAVRWERMGRNPAKAAGRNPKPPPRAVRAFTRAELDAIAAELAPAFRPLPLFAAATGLRPEEWQALERRDVDRRAGLVHVRRTVSSGEVVELGKTERSRRQVPLSPWAQDALDTIPPRLDTPLIFPAVRADILNLDNFRRREWAPAIEAGGIARPARIYDLRSTFASNALAAGIGAFELAKVMGTSIEMIERHYGTLLDGASAGIADRLGAFQAELERATQSLERS
jgi:integrase